MRAAIGRGGPQGASVSKATPRAPELPRDQSANQGRRRDFASVSAERSGLLGDSLFRMMGLRGNVVKRLVKT
jgi:hypothetical protein